MKNVKGSRHDAPRIYYIGKTIIFIIALLSGMSAVYYGYIVGSGSVQTEWSGYCSQYKDAAEYANCMMLSGKLISKFKGLIWINAALAATMLLLYFAGIWLYNKTRIQ